MEYTSLASLSTHDFENLNVLEFTFNNAARYINSIMSRISECVDIEEARCEIINVIVDIAYTPMSQALASNIDIDPDKRDQVMLGTLKSICMTRVVEHYLPKSFQAGDKKVVCKNVSFDEMVDSGIEFTNDHELYTGLNDGIEFVYHSADSSDSSVESDSETFLTLLEKRRHLLTNTQYEIVHALVVERVERKHLQVTKINRVLNCALARLGISLDAALLGDLDASSEAAAA